MKQVCVANRSKTPSASLVVMTNLVLPKETNFLGNLFGGELLSRMDRAASISAMRHSESVAVTVSVNHVSFDKPIPQGSVVVVESKISRSFRSSMEIYVDVWIDDPVSQEKIPTNSGIYTFVAVDRFHKPIPVPPVCPETNLEKERYESALRRKELSLILSGKMKPSDSAELRKMFLED